MTLSLVTAGSAAAATFTMPAHQAGDLIVIWAFRSGNATAPTLGAGFTNLQAPTTTSASGRVGKRIATGTDNTSDPAGTWTNATHIHFAIYRSNVAGATVDTGASANSVGNSTAVGVPALTLQTADGTSWVHGGVGAVSAATIGAFTGLTQRTTQGSAPISKIMDTNGGVSSWTAKTGTASTTGRWVGVAVEIKEHIPPAPPDPTGDVVIVDSTTTGATAFTTSRAPAVPAGVTTADVVIVDLSRWADPAANPAITAPSGFVYLGSVTGTDNKQRLERYAKRLTDADTGTYSFSWSGTTMWTTAHATAYRGVDRDIDLTTLDKPTAVTMNTTSFPSVATTSAAAEGSALHWHGAQENSGTSGGPTSPAGMTVVEDDDVDQTSHLDSVTAGSYTLSGAVAGATTNCLSSLIVLPPEPLAGGGTSPVGKDLQTIWNTRAAVGDPLQLAWGVRTAIGDDLQLPWNVRAALGKTLQTIWDTRAVAGRSNQVVWNTRALVGDDLQLIWNVQFGVTTAVGKDLGLVWNTRALAGASSQLFWNTRAVIGKPLQALWSVRSVVGDPLDLRWGVRLNMPASLALQWSVRQVVGDPLDLRWGVRTFAGKSLSMLWNTRAPVGDDLQLIWDVDSIVPMTQVGKDLSLAWSVRQAVGDPLTLRWNTRQAVADALALVWAVRAATGKNLSIVWNTRAIVSDTIDLRWGVRTVVGKSGDLRWAVQSTAGKSLVLIWDTEGVLYQAIVGPFSALRANTAMATIVSNGSTAARSNRSFGSVHNPATTRIRPNDAEADPT